MLHLDVCFEETAKQIPVLLQDGGGEFRAEFGAFQQVTVGSSRPYEGDYEVTPTVEGVTLPTKSLIMRHDLQVKRIPFFETGNPAGGETVYIAADLDE